MTEKKLTAEADVVVQPTGASGVEVRVAGIRIKDGEGKVVRTIPRPPRRRFGEGEQTR